MPKEPGFIPPPSDEEWKKVIKQEKAEKTSSVTPASEQKIAPEKKKVHRTAKPVVESKPEATPEEKQTEVSTSMKEVEVKKPETATTQQLTTADVVCLNNLSSEEEKQEAELESIINPSNINTDEFREALSTPGTHVYTVLSGIKPDFNPLCFINTGRAMEAEITVRDLLKKNQTLTANDFGGTSFGPSEAQGGAELTGNRALMMTLSRTQGLKRVYLYNSGFNVTMRPLTMAEISLLMNLIDMDKEEIGSTFGSFSYMAADLNIKQRFMELLPATVVGSNLKGYEVDNRLLRCISINDYETLVWAFLCMMYRNGYDARYACVNPECHYTTNVKIDLNKVLFNCYDRIPNEAKEFTRSNNSVTEKDLENYRENVTQLGKEVHRHKNSAEFVFKFNVPTIAEYLKVGQALLNRVFTLITGEHSFRNEEMARFYSINSIRMIQPWVKSFSTYFNGKPDFTTTDQEAITHAIDSLYTPSTMDDFREYVDSTKVSHFCYPCLKCPECGKVPGRSVQDYYPIDINQLFFVLCSLILTQEE